MIQIIVIIFIGYNVNIFKSIMIPLEKRCHDIILMIIFIEYNINKFELNYLIQVIRSQFWCWKCHYKVLVHI